MASDETDQSRKKRRFQWSLRMMIAAVLIYGMLWTVTAKFGVQQIKGQYRRLLLPSLSFELNETQRGFVVKDFMGKEDSIILSSPAPFVVETRFGDTRVWHYWFFGWTNAPMFEPLEEILELKPLH